jgi:hypothetical protein
MTEKPAISREKLETFFRSAKETTEGIDDNNRFLYVTGRNILADAGLASLFLGDFDEGVS